MLFLVFSCKRKESFTGIGQYIAQVKTHAIQYESAFIEVEKYHAKFPQIILSLDSIGKNTELYKILNALNIDDVHIYGEGKPHLIFKRIISNQDYGVSISKDFTNYIKDTTTSKFMIMQIDSGLVLFAEKDW